MSPRRRAAGRPRHVALAAVVLTTVTLLLASACTVDDEWRAAAGLAGEHTEATFYRAPDPLPPGEPGTLIRSERVLGAPEGAIGWRVMYHSRDAYDRDIAVTGVVLAPADPLTRRDRPVVSWGHPTTGAAQKCAPSLGIDPFDTIEGARALLDQGYVVAATDYPGMGTSGPDSYLIGLNEGRSVLDAARAARTLRETGAGDRLLLWGHSQGGQAVLFAAQEAPGYAPELDLAAVAVAAPATELGELLHADLAEQAGVSLGSYAFNAYDSFYGPTTPGLSLDQILSPVGAAVVPEIAELCLFGQKSQIHAAAAPFIGHFVTHDPQTVEPWAGLLEENTPGASPLGAPVLVAQGLSDQLVHPEVTERYVQHLCATGEQVHFRTYEHIDHALIALRAVPAVVDTFRTALAGDAPVDDC